MQPGRQVGGRCAETFENFGKERGRYSRSEKENTEKLFAGQGGLWFGKFQTEFRAIKALRQQSGQRTEIQEVTV